MTKVYRSTIKDIVVIEPKVFHDSRGYFLESFRSSLLDDIGCKVSFVQENQVNLVFLYKAYFTTNVI